MKDFCCWLMSPQQLLPPRVFNGTAVPEAYREKITQKEKTAFWPVRVLWAPTHRWRVKLKWDRCTKQVNRGPTACNIPVHKIKQKKCISAISIKTHRHLYRSRRPRASFRNSVYQQVCAQAGSGMNVSICVYLFKTNSFKPKFVSEFTVCKKIMSLKRAYRIKYITFKCKWRKFTDTQTKHFTDFWSELGI